MKEKNTINWGIMGCGGIAKEFAGALEWVSHTKITACASRSGKAAEFAETFHIANNYNQYEDFAADESVDVVYVATTHNYHYENVKLLLNAGKHVLCEKAFTHNLKEAQELIDLAKKKELFLMEAMWTRFAPAILRMHEMLNQGILGEIKLMQGQFSIDVPFDPKNRLYNPNLAGGALLDLGIYPITMACIAMGEYPTVVQSSMKIGKTGVDEQSSYMLKFANGAVAQLHSACNYQSPMNFIIYGSKGHMEIPGFNFPDRLILHIKGQKPEQILCPYESTGKNYEAQDVVNCLRQGQLESSIQSHHDTLKIMEIMDDLRRGKLSYPQELK